MGDQSLSVREFKMLVDAKVQTSGCLLVIPI